jgi:hypothetical protein
LGLGLPFRGEVGSDCFFRIRFLGPSPKGNGTAGFFPFGILFFPSRLGNRLHGFNSNHFAPDTGPFAVEIFHICL